MQYEIHGTTMQTLDVRLERGEAMYTESGGMAWMSGDIEMKTNTRGGLLAGLGRKLAGESLFMTTYTCRGEQGLITFTPEAPGKMCAETSVKLAMHFRKRLGAGLFGGEGFILQKITGPGTVFLEIGGEVRDYTLQPGQVMKVDPGHIALYEPTVQYDVTTVKGVTNILFGGEGLFLATLTGPGRVWLQSLPLSNLAAKLHRYMPAKG